MTSEKAFAWFAHAYTALGLVAGAVMVVLILRGGDSAFRWTFVLMMVATAIDATDGWLARRARVKEVLPEFDGGALDDLIDFQTYTSIPLLLLWRAHVFSGALAWVLLLPLLSSAYGFSQVHAKTADGFFLGFPSYWNIVAFYFYVLQPPTWFSVAVLATFAVLTFVPTPYIYATRGGPFAKTINIGSAIWFIAIGFALIGPVEYRQGVALASLAYPLMYFGLSVLAGKRRSVRR